VAVALIGSSSWETSVARAGVEFRPATRGDLDFALTALEASMRESVEAAYGAWDAAEQRALFARSFDLASHRIVRCDGADTGVLAVESRVHCLHLARVFLLPRFQRRGIGTRVVRALLESARARPCPLELRFYERLGFRVVGETPTHWLLEAE
jgi:GNAT superfamily N-acetyltransferase